MDCLGCGDVASGLPAGDGVADALCSGRTVFRGTARFALGWGVVCHDASISRAAVRPAENRAHAAIAASNAASGTSAAASALRDGIFPASDAPAFILAMVLRPDS